MAYENYSQVSWTDGSPITGEKLQQMSTNIQQVKEATDDSPQGIKKFKSSIASIGNIPTFGTTHQIIALKDETETGGPDYRVTIDPNRYYRVTLHFTGFKVNAKGAEDARYTLAIRSGLHGSANTLLHQVDFTPPIFAHINVAANANASIGNIALRDNAYPSFFGAGVYQIILNSSGGFFNRSYFAEVSRAQGASVNNAPSFTVPTTPTTGELQLYVEDIGGTA
jgi:hypothetical protein